MFVLGGATLVYLTAFGYNFVYSRNRILAETEKKAAGITAATVSRIETVISGVEKVPAYLARSLEKGHPELASLRGQIENLLSANLEIYGTAVAFEPLAYDGKKPFFAPYVYRGEEGLQWTYIEGETYNYTLRDWYQIPKEIGRPVWSEPYFDEGAGNIQMATYSVPFYGREGAGRVFKGVVTADLSLAWLQETVTKLIPPEIGYAFVISRNGVFVVHPNGEYVMKESIFSIAETHNDKELRRIGRHMTWGGEGFVAMESYFTGTRARMYYAPLPSTGWSLGLVFPENVLFAEIHKLGWTVLFIGLVGLAALSLLVVAVAGRVTRPLTVLSEKAGEIARGNLDVEVPRITSGDEVGELSRSFADMKQALKAYIRNLAETTAAKERIEKELQIAHDIQLSLVPKEFPTDPSQGFAIYATMEPAREVGGDLYDFFVDEGRICFALGDVSGKGVPAALFMAVTKTLIRGVAVSGATPS
ncbi:MAG: cache domain-containing protein, partial [Syntrophales bacterium]|nr:cache domain-containing protein [Syntrophales bacterium]